LRTYPGFRAGTLGAIIFGLAIGARLAAGDDAPAEKSASNSPSAAREPSAGEPAPASIEQLTEKARKSVVVITVTGRDGRQQGLGVVAIGNPHGLKHSVVTGVVSGTREIDGRQMIQLAIPIEPGNSGGPLLDLEGRVHGLLTMKSAVTENLGFAMPVSALK